MEMKMVTENSPAATTTQKDLIAALEEATKMAKLIPNTTNPSQFLHIISTLHSANTHLANFLNGYPSPAAPQSVAVAGNVEPMEMGEDGVEENLVEKVEERMRDCFMQSNKRRKRPLSPATAAEEEEEERRRVYNGNLEFDPYATKMRALDLIYQFHG